MTGDSSAPDIGFIGLGTMGYDMATHLCSKHRVVAYDKNPKVLAPLRDSEIELAEHATGAAAEKPIVILMLPDTPDVTSVVDEISESLSPGQLVIDMSTISPVATREIGAALDARGIGFIDAPVSGGPAGAKNAALSIMAGASTRDFATAKPVFELMGSTIVHVGEVGAGQTTKLCNQLVCAMNLQAVSEAIALGRANGLDLKKLRRVLMGGSANSWMLENLGTQMIDGDATAGFRIDLMLKDLRLVSELAFQQDLPLPGASLATQLYLEARAHGEGGLGNQGIYRVYDRLTGADTDS